MQIISTSHSYDLSRSIKKILNADLIEPILRRYSNNELGVFIEDEEIPSIQVKNYPSVKNGKPVLVVGFGPAGMFAALKLIEKGYKPIVIERGKDVRNRRRD